MARKGDQGSSFGQSVFQLQDNTEEDQSKARRMLGAAAYTWLPAEPDDLEWADLCDEVELVFLVAGLKEPVIEKSEDGFPERCHLLHHKVCQVCGRCRCNDIRLEGLEDIYPESKAISVKEGLCQACRKRKKAS